MFSVLPRSVLEAWMLRHFLYGTVPTVSKELFFTAFMKISNNFFFLQIDNFFKKEAFNYFLIMLARIRHRVVYFVFTRFFVIIIINIIM